VIISKLKEPRVTKRGKGSLQISHSNFVKLYDITIPQIYFFTLLSIHCFRHCTCTPSHEPLHLQGEIKKLSEELSSQRQNLQLPPIMSVASWMPLNYPKKNYCFLLPLRRPPISTTRYYTLPSLTIFLEPEWRDVYLVGILRCGCLLYSPWR
jgi:hypothetical protein